MKTNHNTKRYPNDIRNKAIAMVVNQNMTTIEAAKQLNVSHSSISRWILAFQKKMNSPTSEQKVPKSDVIMHNQELEIKSQLGEIDDFIHGLKKLIEGYEALKAERNSFMRASDKWKVLAGRLNEDIQRLSVGK